MRARIHTTGVGDERAREQRERPAALARFVHTLWALDAAGRPTTDAKAALAGSLFPLGGAKGAALALAF
jgi:LDH2 family malate/lactate/ureidoglycolate dehydrogenase